MCSDSRFGAFSDGSAQVLQIIKGKVWKRIPLSLNPSKMEEVEVVLKE